MEIMGDVVESLYDHDLKLSYAAGLIDGEGCIGTYWNKVHKNYQLRITVEMVDGEGIDVLIDLFGGKLYHKIFETRRDTYSWMVFGSVAENSLKELLPFLHVKRDIAVTALKADWTTFKGKPLTEAEKEIRRSVNKEIKILNARGLNGIEGNKPQRYGGSAKSCAIRSAMRGDVGIGVGDDGGCPQILPA